MPANVVMTEASGRLKALYGEVLDPIAALIESRSKDYETQSAMDKIFIPRQSTHRQENYRSLTDMDYFLPVGENGGYPQTGYQEGFDKTLTNVTFKNAFAISREIMDDETHNLLQGRPEKFVKSYYAGKEHVRAAMLGGALQQQTSVKWKGWGFDTTGADGRCIFAENHPMKVKRGTQSNIYNAAFSEDALFAAMVAMQNMRDDDGQMMDIRPDTIIIPNLPALRKAVCTVIGSYKTTGSGNNDINPLFGNLDIVIIPELNDYIEAGTAPWLLMDSNYNKNCFGAVTQLRKDLEVVPDKGDNDECIWKGYARFGLGFVDFRAFLACGNYANVANLPAA